MGYCGIRLSPENVGHHEPFSDVRDYAIITVHPKAMKKSNAKLREAVVKHELIHYVQEDLCIAKNHTKKFHRLAEAIGLEKKYRE